MTPLASADGITSETESFVSDVIRYEPEWLGLTSPAAFARAVKTFSLRQAKPGKGGRDVGRKTETFRWNPVGN